MHGTVQRQIGESERDHPVRASGALRPRDAATLVVMDQDARGVRVLMGRRHPGHVFMPGLYVFPGGRTDPGDSRVAAGTGLHPAIARRFSRMGKSPSRSRAIGLSALRETYEEAGLLIGEKRGFATTRAGWTGFSKHGVMPSLENLRHIGRAITPPGRVRRFDAHFFAVRRDSVAVELADGGPSDELQGLLWLSFDDALSADIHDMTRTMLTELKDRLEVDPALDPEAPVPFYRMVGDRLLRDLQ